MDQSAASNHGEELQNLNSDDSPTQISNQAANGDGSTSAYMDADVYTAAAKGDIEVLEEISESEFLVQLSPKHNTILHIASEFGQTKSVNWILGFPSCSSLLQFPNLKGDTPLHLAAREGHLEVVTALLEAAKKLPQDIETGIGVDKKFIRMKNKGKNTALHEAVRFNHFGVVNLLIEEDPEFPYDANDSGTTPLYMAAERGFTYLVELIIDNSTSPSYSGLMGRTALHAAIICNDKEMTEKILGWKMELIEEVDEKGWSPLHYAAERGCDVEIVKLLLEKSKKSVAYLGSKDGNKTALHIASFHHHTKIVEEILSHSPGCREQVDDKGNNVFHFAMMKKRDDDFNPSNYFDNYWLKVRGLGNEKNAQGDTPIHLLSLNEILDCLFVFTYKVDKQEYNNKHLTAYDMILRSKKGISKKKNHQFRDQILEQFEWVMPETRSSRRGKELKWDKEFKRWEKKFKRWERKKRMEEDLTAYDRILRVVEKVNIEKFEDDQKSKEDKEKRAFALRKQGETHLIVSTLITTVTFAAGFTLPGGYKEDEGEAILSKKTAFTTFVVTDTIAMVSSLCAVFLHFFIAMSKWEKFLEKHLVWAFILTMIGMGAMAIAFATGLYAVLPHPSALSFVTCILCSCFFLSFILEYSQNWRGTISDVVRSKTTWLKDRISS